MMFNKKLLVVLFLLISASAFSQVVVQDSETGLSLLAKYLEGDFSSEDQSKSDTNYFHIVLHVRPIWKEQSDALWFYAEQAAAWKQEKPYRQRVYKLTQVDENVFKSEVFTFENPLDFAGDWKKDNPLAGLSPEKLKSRDGCTVFLSKQDEGIFTGSTKGKDCSGDSREAKYVTSEVEIHQNMFMSWDRGFDEKDVQVWGAVNGPYIFKRK